MAIIKDNKRGLYYISYKTRCGDGWKTHNIKNKDWRISGDLKVTMRYMKGIEEEEIRRNEAKALSPNDPEGFLTVSGACELFLKSERIDGMRPGTVYKHGCDLRNYLIPALGAKSSAPSAFTVGNMDALRAALSDAGLSVDTANGKICVFKKLIAFMKSRHMLTRERADDCSDVLKPMRDDGMSERKSKENFFSNGDDDVRKFFATFDSKDGDWLVPIQVLFYGAFRIGEFLAITEDCVNFQNDTIFVCKQMLANSTLENTTKTGSSRYVRLPHAIMESLQAYMSERRVNGGGLVFTGKTGKPMSRMSVRRAVDSHLAMAGLPHITLHGLRHSMATRMFDRGYDVRAVQEQLGHSSMNTTMGFYIHYTESKKKKDVDDLL